MRNPNGYGTVVKLSGNRRNPYAVRKTTGFNEKGHPIYINIGYAATKEEGLIMLAEYNKSPWDIETDKITLEELYKLWLEKRAVKLGKSNLNCMKAAYKHCSKYYNIKYKQLKSYQMQDCIDSCGFGHSTQANIKTLFWHLDRFAMELDIVSKCLSDLLTTDPVPETNKVIFSEEEIKRVWDNQQLPFADAVAFFLYTGFRISEFIEINADDNSYPWTPFYTNDAVQYWFPYVEPEVIAKRDNPDGTFTLTVNVSSADLKADTVFVHEVTIRPTGNNGFQYVSNRIVSQTEYGMPNKQPRSFYRNK